LTGEVAEEGNDESTQFDSDVVAQVQALQARDPQFSRDGFIDRVRLIHHEMNQAWSDLAWDRARPYLTDRLWMAQIYWIQAYRSQGLRNRMDDATVTEVQIVRAQRDPYFDGVTVRMYATGHDYTVDSSGRVVAGNKHRPRPYSEYWTLIRSARRTG